MKKKLITVLCCIAMMFSAAVPAWADSEGTVSAASTSEKAVTSNDTNPNTGVVTLATVSVALAGCVVVVFKKRK